MYKRRRRLNRNGKILVCVLAVLLILLIVLIVRGCSGSGEESSGQNESSISQESSLPAGSSEEPSGAESFETPESSAESGESSGAAESSTAEGSAASPSAEDWRLTLVNNTHPLEDGYVPELADAREAGLSPIICSAYRTWEKQTSLFEDQVAVCESQGLEGEAAVAEARTVVAYPGTSEHQLGLAADIVALSYQILDEGQMETAEQQWLIEHCAEYGFILRYPEGKSDITGVIFEPWHYRYVGVEAAKEIMSQGLCLEEYLGQAE